MFEKCNLVVSNSSIYLQKVNFLSICLLISGKSSTFAPSKGKGCELQVPWIRIIVQFNKVKRLCLKKQVNSQVLSGMP